MVEMNKPTLRIEDLTVAYRYKKKWHEAVREFFLQIEPGQTYGLVGESGSGKTTVVMAIMDYLKNNGSIMCGSIEFKGIDLLSISDDEKRKFWGSDISLVPQNPLASLNPSIRVGEQITETLMYHLEQDSSTAKERTIDLLRQVQISDPIEVIRSYPHQLSGGMQQRILIAMAVSTNPHLLILDEPTSSLDVTTQASILELIQRIIKETHSAVLYVTHNLGVVAQICDRVAVLYASELVEDAPIWDIFQLPVHPYTKSLLDSIPKIGQTKKTKYLLSIKGHIPALGSRPEGCLFAQRCPYFIDLCETRPPIEFLNKYKSVRCHRWKEIISGTIGTQKIEQEKILIKTKPKKEADILKIKGVSIHFDRKRSVVEKLSIRTGDKIQVVNNINISVPQSMVLGLVGESGSGKTTLARAIVGLVEPESGEFIFLGITLPKALEGRNINTLRRLQMVFQNPDEALNPYMTIGETIRRPIMKLMNLSWVDADIKVAQLLDAVQLPAEYSSRKPDQLSGGEKQRVAIARSLASNPDLLIADEPVSALDVSVQASILNLLNALQVESNSSMILISHDLAVVGYLADMIAVIYMGQLVEVAPSESLIEPPFHPYTEALISAIPIPNPSIQQNVIKLERKNNSDYNEQIGCPFFARCHYFLGEICRDKIPPWHVDEHGKSIKCHLDLQELHANQERSILY